MKCDLLISYSQTDKKIADAVCSILEKRGIRCWIAPRDITPGTEWASAIAEAIPSCRIFVLIHSKTSNESKQVMREVERAVHHGLTIIPFRTEDVALSKSLEYFISSCHWLDAMTPPIEDHINFLADSVLQLLSGKNESGEQRHWGNIAVGKAYRLGFSLAKITFYSGDNLGWMVLHDHFNTFAKELALPKEILSASIEQIKCSNDPKNLVPNFRIGCDACIGIGSLIRSRIGDKAETAFRLGFNMISITAQFVFLSTRDKHTDSSFQELIDGLTSLLKSLIEGAILVGITEKIATMLKSIEVDPKKETINRMLLIKVGNEIDKELNGT